MKTIQYLLGMVSEECAEIAQRASKASRFGLNEKHPNNEFDNKTLLLAEYFDLAAVIDMLENLGAFKGVEIDSIHNAKIRKSQKLAKFMTYSKDLGLLEEDDDFKKIMEMQKQPKSNASHRVDEFEIPRYATVV